ncbi:MAG: TonB-dependent receptor [Myxococcota bacterium]|nr:TonB-dependent receptor [Myxococcota bacterium]
MNALWAGVVLLWPHAALGDPPTATTDVPAEVLVRGTRGPPRDIGSEEARAQDLRDVPGTFGEPFQAVAALPGIASIASGLPYFYVRGAAPADTGYYLDGIALPALFHVGPGPSVIPPGLVDRIQFFPGAAPPRFGRYVGGIIAAETLPPRETAHGEASVRWFDANAVAESPLGDGWTALVAGRYGYPGLVLSALHANVSLAYGDYTARLTRKISDSDMVTLFAIGGYDSEADALDLFPVDTQFHRLDVRFDHRWVGGSLRVATTFGYDRTEHPFANGSHVSVGETSSRLRVEIEERLGSVASVSAGADASSAHYAYGYGARSSFSPIDIEQIAGAYVQLHLRLARHAEIVPGIRVDAYRSDNQVTSAADPKLSARVGLSPDVTWVSLLGVAHQEPTFLLPIPGLRVDPAGGLQEVFQFAEGIEARLPAALWGSLTAFLNADRGTNDFVADCGTLSRVNCSVVDRVNGRTYGLEILVRRSLTERLGGWLAYTLSRAEREVGGVPYLSPVDRTHVLSAVLRYDFGRGLTAGLRATLYSGRPDFPRVTYGDGTATVAFGPGEAPQHRLPPFYRFDLRAQKRWELGDGKWFGVDFDFFNATLSREALAFQCDFVTASEASRTVARCSPYRAWIALPSIGLEGGF